jgi:hypothetical protein
MLYAHHTTLNLPNMVPTQGDRDDDIAMIARLRCLPRNSRISVVVMIFLFAFVGSQISERLATGVSMYKDSIRVENCRLRLLIVDTIDRCCHDHLSDL